MIGSRVEEYASDPTALADDAVALVRGEDSTHVDAMKIWLTDTLRRWRRSLPEE